MRFIIIFFVVTAVIGIWLLLTRLEVLPEIGIGNIFDKEAIGEWFARKLQEISEQIGYEPGAIYKN